MTRAGLRLFALFLYDFKVYIQENRTYLHILRDRANYSNDV